MKVVMYYNCPVPVTFLSNTFHLGRVLDEAHTTATCFTAHKMKVLQQVLKITTDIYTGVSLTHKQVYHTCKEFLGLVPKPAHQSHLHIAFNSPKTWRSRDDTSKLCASPTVWHLVSPELCRPHADMYCRAAWQCRQWIYLMFVLRYAISEASESNCLQLLHHYMIWSPEGGLPQSPPGPLWMDLPHSRPSFAGLLTQLTVLLCTSVSHCA